MHTNVNIYSGLVNDTIHPFLARLFLKKTSRYCYSPGIGSGSVVRRHVKTLTFSISVITEDIYLKLRVVVRYQMGNPYQQGR